jgi:hypothetical protein
MDKQTERYAVLKGDIVGSTKLSTQGLSSVLNQLRKGVESFFGQYRGAVYGKMDVFSGDSWQLLMPDWRRSVRAALYLRAVVKSDAETKIDTRIAIGWGAVDADSLKRNRITESTGEAFTRSGHTLEKMAKHARLAFDGGETGTPLVRASLALADELAGRWTPTQAQAVAMALLGQKQDEIASASGKKQPTVYKALRSAGWRGIETFLEEIEYSL